MTHSYSLVVLLLALTERLVGNLVGPTKKNMGVFGHLTGNGTSFLYVISAFIENPNFLLFARALAFLSHPYSGSNVLSLSQVSGWRIARERAAPLAG